MAIRAVWPYLDHVDPMLRHAARVALEQHATRHWRDRALEESRPTAALTAMLALARSGQTEITPRVLRRLNEFDFETLDATQRVIFLRVVSLCLMNKTTPEPAILDACIRQLDDAFPDTTSSSWALPPPAESLTDPLEQVTPLPSSVAEPRRCCGSC